MDATDQLQDIWLIDANGRPLIATNIHPAPRDVSLKDREYFRVHSSGEMKQGEIYVSELLRGRADPTRTFFQISIARYGADGAFRGVTALSLEPRYFRTIHSQVLRRDIATVSLTRADGSILALSPPRPDEFISMPSGSKFLQAVGEIPERGVYFTLSVFDDVPRMVAYRKLSGMPIYLTASMNISDIDAKWKSQSISHLYFGIPAVLVLLLLLTYAYRQHQSLLRAYTLLSDAAAERLALQGRIHQAEKLEALGRLTAVIAHDFNNFIAAFGGALRFVTPHVPTDSKAHLALTHAESALASAGGLVQQLLKFGRAEKLNITDVNINDLVEQIAGVVRLSLPANIALHTSVSSKEIVLPSDKNILESALLNLCVNAKDALPSGGAIRIKVTRESHLFTGDPVAVDCCVIEVEDNGTGMSKEVLAKAIEPFFTTKGTRLGNGLGLSQVHGFVRQTGGDLALSSEVGRGTRIRIFLRMKPLLTGPELLAGDAPQTEWKAVGGAQQDSRASSPT
ncbi:MAG: ATP-binding protein [Beijerinckiaceae bacterium]|nr:ATP-binding protein [Beijerinckiaceae bacterium]